MRGEDYGGEMEERTGQGIRIEEGRVVVIEEGRGEKIRNRGIR